MTSSSSSPSSSTNSSASGSPSRIAPSDRNSSLRRDEVEDEAVQQLDRRRLLLHRVGGGGDRLGGRREVPDGHDANRPHRHERDLGLDHDARACPPSRRRPATGRPPRPPRRSGRAGSRPPGASGAGSRPSASRCRSTIPGRPRWIAPASVSAAPRRAASARDTGSEPGARPVGEHDVEALDRVDRHPVPDRLAAGRVVADHAAERRPVRGRGVRPELQAVRARRRG